jgi:UDP-3-O-[3-hydroxymyristoyl] glucosamine N-acyltransferase
MELSLKEISELVQGTLIGDGEILIRGVAGIKEAQAGQITFLSNPKYFAFVADTKASAVLISQDAPVPDHKPVIVCKSPSLAFSKVIERFNPMKSRVEKGVHATAILGKGVHLGKEISIGPYVVIEDHVSIGDRSVISAGSFLGNGAKIGEDVLVYPNVTIRESTVIGNRVVIHSGTVIGSDGFGYETVEGVHHKIPQVGIVMIEDDVELGANVTVDRARFGKTVIGKGTKIDNLVQIAHNVEIGQSCMIVAQVGISGTTKIGNHVTLAGQVGVVGHIEVGDHVVVAAQAGVSNSIPSGEIYGGYPAVPLQEWKRNVAHIRRLEKIVDRLRVLEKKVQEIEKI